MDTLSDDPHVLAADLKTQGNAFYKEQKYKEAIAAYSRAIELVPDPQYLNNRAAAYIMVKNFAAALADAQEALKKEPANPKFLLRAARASLSLGRLSDAARHCEAVLQLEPGNATALQDLANVRQVEQFLQQAKAASDEGFHNNSISLLNRALDIAPDAILIKLLLAEDLLAANRGGDAERIASAILREDRMHAEALYVRGQCLYARGELEQAVNHYRNCLQSNPDHVPGREALKHAKSLLALKEEGANAFKQGRLEEALALYKKALEMDPKNDAINSKLCLNCAIVASKMERLEEGIAYCNRALALDESYAKALLKRAELYLKAEQFEEAIKDYELALERDPSNRELRGSLRQAKLEQKKAQRKDYYKLLGVAKAWPPGPLNADENEIKKAYKKAALRCHPDRVNPDDKEAAEAQFKEIGEAYAVLSDPRKKQRYDSGQDIEEEMGHGHGHGHGMNVDVHQMFAQMFAGRGNGGFRFGGGFPGHHQAEYDDDDEYE